MKMKLPKKVMVGECVVREGVQHEEHFIPTEAKLWLLKKLLDAGFKKVEVTNFASPKYLPQFRDAEEVLKGIQPLKEGVIYSGVAGTQELYTPSDITGNVRSEDLIVMLDEMGIETGLDVDMVLEIGRTVERIFGRRLRSYTVETGRIPKSPTGR